MSSRKKVARFFTIAIAVVVVWRLASELAIAWQRTRDRRPDAGDGELETSEHRGAAGAREHDGAPETPLVKRSQALDADGDGDADFERDDAVSERDDAERSDAVAADRDAGSTLEVRLSRLQRDTAGHGRVDEWYRATMLRTFYVVGAMLGMLATVVAAVTLDTAGSGSAVILAGGLVVVAACSYGILQGFVRLAQ